MSRRQLVLLIATGAVLLAGTAAARSASQHLHLPDTPGDSFAAPDITAVNLGNDVVAGPIVMWIKISNRQRLASSDSVLVFFDTDLDPQTGAFGAEYIFVASGGGAHNLVRPVGDFVQSVPAPSLRWNEYDAKEMRLSIHPSDLGGVKSFAFFVTTAGATDNDVDFVPNSGLARYELRPGPLRLAVERLTAKPRVPTAGRAISVAMSVARIDTFEGLEQGRITCTAKVGTARIPARGRWAPSGATCTTTPPRTAKGKRLTVTVAVAYGGASVSRTYRGVVR